MPAASPAPGHAPGPGSGPAPVTNAQRRACADRLRAACADGRLTFGELSERTNRAWAARTSTELERAEADLRAGHPEGAEARRAPQAPTTRMVTLLGDGRRFGRWRLARRTVIVNGLGNWALDLRGALLDERILAEATVDLCFVSLVGDLTISVPDGVGVDVSGLVALGDRHVDLAVVPTRPGMPRLRLRLAGLIGDLRITSGSLLGRPGQEHGRGGAGAAGQPTGLVSSARVWSRRG
ncbi:DUF1707 domain-containing protein [Parafrankia sp. EUN1f]|uniref:DUF1707 SHOCT-like domain-containing protein n=1 Tax=Parafrankia sp. EUN1f TaxID=102897 RepID=UPI0001C45685|nr:DUF1707 domain-containing protein [Parafrankia sp. EUN1f]EFC82306.1 protein of unknown function DUF1707 [Parafrankia sp. EUN1f]